MRKPLMMGTCFTIVAWEDRHEQGVEFLVHRNTFSSDMNRVLNFLCTEIPSAQT